MGPRDDLDAVTKGKIPILYRESNPGRPARSLVIILTGLLRLRKKNNYVKVRKD